MPKTCTFYIHGFHYIRFIAVNPITLGKWKVKRSLTFAPQASFAGNQLCWQSAFFMCTYGLQSNFRFERRCKIFGAKKISAALHHFISLHEKQPPLLQSKSGDASAKFKLLLNVSFICHTKRSVWTQRLCTCSPLRCIICIFSALPIV